MHIRTALLNIDFQNDFGDQPGAALPVPGAMADAMRMAMVVRQRPRRFEHVVSTLDTHARIDIAHPAGWRDPAGNMPAPFTCITAAEVARGDWVPYDMALLYDRWLAYVRALEETGRFLLIVWPTHCVHGTWGHKVLPVLQRAYTEWERVTGCKVEYVRKGSNPNTEHFGAFAAEVPDPADSATALNVPLLEKLARFDQIVVAGEAKSHCVRVTVDQLAEYLGTDRIHRIVLLTDCTSPVAAVPGGPDFPAIAGAWQAEMQNRGMRVGLSTDFV